MGWVVAGARWGEGHFLVCIYLDIQSKSNMPYNSTVGCFNLMCSQKRFDQLWQGKQWCLCFVHSVFCT